MPATTSAASAEPNSPKAALRALNLALRDGNASAVRKLFEPTDADSDRLIEAMANYSAALVALHKAALNAYGPDGANLVTGDINAQSADGLTAIDKAKVDADESHATVRFVGASDPPVQLVKIHGLWKLPVAQLLGSADKLSQRGRIKELQQQSAMAKLTADEIDAGQYREAPSRAAAVWRSRLLQPPAVPQTNPATPPTTLNAK